MNQEQLIRTNEIGFMSNAYLAEVQKALLSQPAAENIHFVINVWHGNVKLGDTPLRERWPRYETRITVHLTELRKLVKDPLVLAASVITKLYTDYKHNLVFH